MNRSQKISRQARQSTAWALVISMIALALVAWAVVVWMSNTRSGGALFVGALAALRLAWLKLREGWRLAGLAELEEWHENGGGRCRL